MERYRFSRDFTAIIDWGDLLHREIAEVNSEPSCTELVRRANAYDELREALELAEATITRIDPDHSSTRGTLDVIRTALAKCQGEA